MACPTTKNRAIIFRGTDETPNYRGTANPSFRV